MKCNSRYSPDGNHKAVGEFMGGGIMYTCKYCEKLMIPHTTVEKKTVWEVYN